MDWLLLQFTERLLRGLKRVSWEKVDVSFHNSKVRSAAHSVIQVWSWATCDFRPVSNLAATECLWKLYWSWSTLERNFNRWRILCCIAKVPMSYNIWLTILLSSKNPGLWKQIKPGYAISNCWVDEPGEHVYGNLRYQRFMSLMDQVYRGVTLGVCPLVHLVICDHICCVVL